MWREITAEGLRLGHSVIRVDTTVSISPLPNPGSPASRSRARPSKLPLLARFADLRDPWAVRRLDPLDLSAFGAGVRLRGIAARVVGERPTFRLRAMLPWFRERPGAFIVGPDVVRVDPSLAETLRVEDFVRDG